MSFHTAQNGSLYGRTTFTQIGHVPTILQLLLSNAGAHFCRSIQSNYILDLP